MLIFEAQPLSPREDNISYDFDIYVRAITSRSLHLKKSRILFHPEAKEQWQAFQKSVNGLHHVLEEDLFQEAVAGTATQAMKLAMATCDVDFDQNRFTISLPNMAWAIGVATLNLKKQYRLFGVDDASQNTQSKLYQRVWTVIYKSCQKGEALPKSYLRRHCRELDAKDRDNILEDLKDKKLIILTPWKTHGNVITLTEKGRSASRR